MMRLFFAKPIQINRFVRLSCMTFISAAAALGGLAHPARATIITNAEFSLKISEKEAVLANPMDMGASWDVGFQRVLDRNMPTVELLNELASTAPITELRMTIGDERFNYSNDYFGVYAELGTTSQFMNISSTIDDGGNTLVVNFLGGGLLPGQFVRFRIDLDVDAGFDFFPHPDFRTVLFDMNSIQVYDGNAIDPPPGTDDNANVFVQYSLDGMMVTPEAVFPDAIVTGPEGSYYNNIYRPYGVMEGIDTFPIGGGMQIPEPGSLALAIFACIGGMGVSRRRGRRARQERNTQEQIAA